MLLVRVEERSIVGMLTASLIFLFVSLSFFFFDGVTVPDALSSIFLEEEAFFLPLRS